MSLYKNFMFNIIRTKTDVKRKHNIKENFSYLVLS